MKFFVGLHQPSDARHFERCFVSINRLRTRKKPMEARDWILDSGAFTELSRHGKYRDSVAEYANQIERVRHWGNLLACCAQDYMCEPFVLSRTGMSIEQHQRLTIERYDALRALVSTVYVLPVLQGYTPRDYTSHLNAYGDRLKRGAWVGVGSVCKRNSRPGDVVEILRAIMSARPDLQLHGFGLKKTAFELPGVVSCLATADSMAWSYAARRERANGRRPNANANDWREAKRFERHVNELVSREQPGAKRLPCQ